MESIYIDRKIHFINLGCKVNYAELSRLKKMFNELNYITTENINEADVILVNTCSVTNQADSDSRKLIRRARVNNPEAFIGVLGCYAQLQPSEISQTTEADAIFSINDKFNIPHFINSFLDTKRANCINDKEVVPQKIDNSKFDYAFSADNETRTRAFMKLQDGCDFKCSYCTIPLARGGSRSLKFSDLLKQIEEIYLAGFKEIVIAGINLSSYQSENKDFYDLISTISNIKLDIQFRISSIEPQSINQKLLEIISNSENICSHFHIPLQSGCDEILKNMKRRYNTSQFSSKINIIRQYIPQACIGLDVISGFPGETEILFDKTYEFIKQLDINYLHCFSYSKRRNTPAADMPGQVEKSEKKRRTRLLVELSNEKILEYYKKYLGQKFVFLPEKYDSNRNIAFGHTKNYIPVEVEAKEKLENKFYLVQLNSIIKNKKMVAANIK